MLTSHMKIALRNFSRNRTLAAINVTGLAIGLACAFLIFLWVSDETSYDRYHANADRIHRVYIDYHYPDYVATFARVPYGFVNALPEAIPEIEDMVRFHHELTVAVKREDVGHNESRFFNADANVFSVFDFELLEGDPASALTGPGSVVLSETTARRYFGKRDPMGQTLTVMSQSGIDSGMYTVTGVMADTPPNSHFHVDFLAAFDAPRQDRVDQWNYVYVLLNEGADPTAVQAKLPAFTEANHDPNRTRGESLHLQPPTSIHLHSALGREIEPNGDADYVRLFSIVAILSLLVAAANFVNLSTARASSRMTEVAIRKTVGASRAQLFGHYVGESVLTALAALLVASVLIELALPAFNQIAGKEIAVGWLEESQRLAVLIGLAVAVGIAAGVYPAWRLSNMQPVRALKSCGASHLGVPLARRSKLSPRNVLVVAQFAIAITLVVGCAATYAQYRFMTANRLGGEGEQIVAIPNIPNPAMGRYRVFKEELLSAPGVLDVTASMEQPTRPVLDALPYEAEGVPDNGERASVFVMSVDANFFDFYGSEFATGTAFSGVKIEGGPDEYVLNEAAARMIGWTPEEAVGKQFRLSHSGGAFELGPVVGVVKDMHQSSMREAIKPMAYCQRSNWMWCFLVKLAQDDIPASLASVERVWSEVNPEYPLKYVFVDDLYDRLYRAERRQAVLLGVFASVAALVACLGLLGLTVYAVERRTKELGVRKVLGASTARLVILLSTEYAILLALANLVAWPAARYAVNAWLQGFAYRVEVSLAVFAGAAVLTLLLALGTVASLAFRAARSNPINALKYE